MQKRLDGPSVVVCVSYLGDSSSLAYFESVRCSFGCYQARRGGKISRQDGPLYKVDYSSHVSGFSGDHSLNARVITIILPCTVSISGAQEYTYAR